MATDMLLFVSVKDLLGYVSVSESSSCVQHTEMQYSVTIV